MSKLLKARSAQRVLSAEFTFNFDDTMKPISGGTPIAGSGDVDFGKTNVLATVFEVIPLPIGAVVVSGEVVTDVAFDTASYAVSIGDATDADRYLVSTDRKAAGRSALTPTGYRHETGEDLRVSVTNADVCTAGKMTVRVQYVITGRADEATIN